MAAWEALRADRQTDGMGGQSRISFLAIDAWARRCFIQDDEFDMYRRLILALDDEYLAWRAREQEKARQQAARQQGLR